MKALLDRATNDFRYADFLARLGKLNEAKRIRQEARALLQDMPRSNTRLQLTPQRTRRN